MKALGLFAGWRRIVGLILLIVGTASGLVDLWLFPQYDRASLAWFFYIISVVFFVAGLFATFAGQAFSLKNLASGGLQTRPTETIVRGLFVNWKYALAWTIIFGLAIFMRLYLFSSIPFGTWFDEADIGQNALDIVDGASDFPVYYGWQSRPFHFTYLVSLSLRLFGVGTLSIRMVSVVFGLLAVFAAFLLGKEILSPRFGLILAFFFAVGRWHVTFSRLGMATVATPFFVLLTFYFLFRAMRTKKPLDFGLGGVALGIGLDFHTAFRVIPLAVFLFFLYWLVRFWRDGSVSSTPRTLWIVNLAVFLLGAGLAVAPIGQYALIEPESFWQRTNEVSIFQNRDDPNLGRALVSNMIEHLLMFNYQGDRNGRHNLPGESMLDPVSGVLFVLGFGLALRRLKHPAEFAFLVIFLVGLSAGIFSVDFEAPQAQRSIPALPAVYFFAALAVETIWRGFQCSGKSQIRQLFWTLVILVAGCEVVYLNAHTYFTRQADNSQVWYAHDPVETMIGKELRELDPNETTVYLSMFLQNDPVIQFTAHDFGATKLILPPDGLPLREPGDKAVVVFLDLFQDWALDGIPNLYPAAKHSVVSDPLGNPIYHMFVIPREDIQAIQGLMARYWQGSTGEGEPAFFGPDRMLDFSWPEAAPISPPFVAVWEGVLYIPKFDRYQLWLESPGEATLWLDEELLIENDSGAEGTIDIQLAQGNHTLLIRAGSGEGTVRLSWRGGTEGDFEAIPAEYLYLSPPIFSHGLVGSYYEMGDWEADPAIVRIDPFIDMYFHLTPLPRPYGVEWKGEIEIPTTGEYEFGLRVTGDAQLYINDELVVDAAGPTEYLGGRIQLIAGRNKLRLRFLDYLGASRIHLYWTKPGSVQTIIPSEVLFPQK